MLIIRQTQLEALQPLVDKVLAAELEEIFLPPHHYLREVFSPDELHDEICRGIARARAYELTADRDIFGFVQLMCAVALRFDMDENVNVLLTDKSVASENRFDNMFKFVTDAEWIRIHNERGLERFNQSSEQK